MDSALNKNENKQIGDLNLPEVEAVVRAMLEVAAYKAIESHLEGKTPKKVIVAKKAIVNIVL